MVFITNDEYKELLEIKFKYELEHEKENCDCEGTVEEIKTVAEVRKLGVGDRVKHLEYGVGTIVFDDGGSLVPFAVEFDTPNEDLHWCNNHTKDNRGYWCDSDDLELVEEREEK